MSKLAHELSPEEVLKLAFENDYMLLYTCMRLSMNGALTYNEAMQTAAVEQAKLIKNLQAELLKYRSEELPQPIIGRTHNG